MIKNSEEPEFERLRKILLDKNFPKNLKFEKFR